MDHHADLYAMTGALWGAGYLLVGFVLGQLACRLRCRRHDRCTTTTTQEKDRMTDNPPRRVRRAIGAAAVAVVVLALSVLTVRETLDSSEQRECYADAAANRSAANDADWAAMDRLVAAIAAAQTDTAATGAALREFQMTRERTVAVREDNPAADNPSC